MATRTPWPPGNPFPASETGDFPSSAGDREHGKFRPSRTSRLTAVAVTNDSGRDIGAATTAAAEDQTLLLRAMVLGLSILTGVDLINEVRN